MRKKYELGAHEGVLYLEISDAKARCGVLLVSFWHQDEAYETLLQHGVFAHLILPRTLDIHNKASRAHPIDAHLKALLYATQLLQEQSPGISWYLAASGLASYLARLYIVHHFDKFAGLILINAPSAPFYAKGALIFDGILQQIPMPTKFWNLRKTLLLQGRCAKSKPYMSQSLDCLLLVHYDKSTRLLDDQADLVERLGMRTQTLCYPRICPERTKKDIANWLMQRTKSAGF